MLTLIKSIIGLFMLVGIALALFAVWQISMTFSFVRTSPGRGTATFTGYHHEYQQTTHIGGGSVGDSTSHTSETQASYPRFAYTDQDGNQRQIREPKAHLFEIYRPGQQVEIVLDSAGNHRLAGVYALYGRDAAILILGIGFLGISYCLWNYFLPLLAAPSGAAIFAPLKDLFAQAARLRIGPLTLSSLLKGLGAVGAVFIVVSLAAAALPFMRQLGIFSGSPLIAALEAKRLDDARTLILKGRRLDATDSYNRSALLIALEGGHRDLAILLIQAGARVNGKSKMYQTPLLLATRAGDLEMVKLLLSRQADPNAPTDEVPPVFHAIAKGYDEIARLLIESGSDLQQAYPAGDPPLTVGDMARMARKAELEALIRGKGGRFGPQR